MKTRFSGGLISSIFQSFNRSIFQSFNLDPSGQAEAGFITLATSNGLWYICTMVNDKHANLEVERVQTGVRLEKRLLKVLKAVAELKDLSLGDLLEGVVLHAFEGKTPFSEQTLKEIEQFKKIYGLTLKASDSHQLRERQR
jgi:hypothetical protein